MRTGCRACDGAVHEFGQLDPQTYAYLLGLYLGDGCVTANHTSWTLRITPDSACPGIVEESRQAVQKIAGGRYVSAAPHHSENHRKIELSDWQEKIVEQAPKPFLRALIQTDGWRGLNRVHVKGKDYAYPRSQFSNRSDDIRKLFTDTCDRLGVQWRQWTRYHVSVAQRESVAFLDSFIGPKY